MSTSSAKEIKRDVRQSYARRATGAAACCLSDSLNSSTRAAPGIYVGTDLEGLPPEVIAASAGCGNPAALADLKVDETVLDLGSGGGIDCFLASRAVGPHGRVLGIDMTPEMVDLARCNASRMGITNVEFHLGELEHLPFDSCIVDVVISNCVVALSPEKDAVFREAFRVMKPDGRLHVSDMIRIGELPEPIRNDPKRWSECVAGADQRDTYLSRLTSVGFHNITMEDEEHYRSELGLENLRSVRIRAVKPI